MSYFSGVISPTLNLLTGFFKGSTLMLCMNSKNIVHGSKN